MKVHFILFVEAGGIEPPSIGSPNENFLQAYSAEADSFSD